MKAVKITKIQWNLNDVSIFDKEDVLDTLPKEIGFTVKDDYKVFEKVPSVLKKKYGHNIDTFSFVECHIPETIDELLKVCIPSGMNRTKNIFTPSGALSSTGKICKEMLEDKIKKRKSLENQGVSPFDMPKILDEVMLGVEKVSGLSWDNHSYDELLAPIYRKIWDKKCSSISKDKLNKMLGEDED